MHKVWSAYCAVSAVMLAVGWATRSACSM